MSRRAVVVLVALVCSPVHAGEHVDARDYPSVGAGEQAFAQMERALVSGFDSVCGDTFCEGEYSNLRALQLRCAVSLADGTVSQCLWSFAGSTAHVQGESPVPQVGGRTYACPLPLAPGTPLSWMLTSLTGRNAIDTPLPGTGRSVYLGLTDCL